MEHFSKNHEVSVNDPEKAMGADIINIHSSGFLESFDLEKYPGKKVYSLHANINPIRFKGVRDIAKRSLFEAKEDTHITQKHRFKKNSIYLLSQFIPTAIKRYFLNKVDKVIVPNAWLCEQLKLSNGRYIRHGIDIEKFRRVLVKKDPTKINVRYFGHPSPGKGLIEVIDSFAKLGKNYEKKIFLSNTNKKIQDYINERDPTIKLHGYTENIVEEYSKADIIVLPYVHSSGAISTPLVLVEAMACEAPVITSDLPHLREICGDTVTYVKPKSRSDLTIAIRKLAKEPQLRREQGRKAREQIVKYHNQKEMFEKYEALYNQLKNES